VLGFHETFGYVAILLTGSAGVVGIGFAIGRRRLPRWFHWYAGAAMMAMALQALVGVYLYQQDQRPGSQHMFYGFVILFTLTFGYVYRMQMSKSPALRWGLFLLFVMGLGIRGVMTVGRSF
jgi:hypothetical protein